MAALEVFTYSRLRHIFPLSSNILKSVNQNLVFIKKYSTSPDDVDYKDINKERLGGFAKAFEKYTTPVKEIENQETKSFAQLLRNSKFIDVSYYFQIKIGLG